MRKVAAKPIVIALACSLIASFTTTSLGYAVGNVAPDSGDYDGVAGGHEVRLVVASGSLEATQAIVYIYSKSPNPTVTIRGADHCYASPSGPSGAVDASNITFGGTDTTFAFFTRNNGAYTYSGLSFGNNTVPDGDSTNPNSACNQATVSRTFTLTDADKMPASTGLGEYYQIKLQVDLVQPANSTNSFKVEVNDGIVSYANTGANNRISLQSRPPTEMTHKSTFNIYFATPCDASAGDLARGLHWYDADQDDFSQNQSTFYFNLLSRPRGSGGSFSTVEISHKSDLGNNNQPGDMNFTFEKNKEYDWQWVGVSEFNGIQFQIPFDSAYQKVSCEGADFQLNPVLVSANPSIVTPATNAIDVTARVDRTGTTASYSDEEWRVTKFIVPPGGALGGGGTGSPPCNQFNGYSACNTVWSAGGVTFTGASTTVVNNGADGVDHTLQPGTKICYIVSVSKWSTGDPSWRHSNTVCSTVVQIPFAYVRGNDLRVGSGFSIATNTTSLMSGYVTPIGATWAEYGVLAPGAVSGVASQSGAVNGGNASAQNTWSKLTFANTGGSYGMFTNASSMGAVPNVGNFLTSSTFSSFEMRNKGNANVSISGELTGAYAAGNFKKSVVIVTTGTVTIDTDIKYTTDTLVGKAQLPQLVIIAGNINITDNVKQVDAWLVSTGTVNTCSNVVPNAASRTNLRTTNCDDALHINGPIMASQLLLGRTYYDSSKVQAAENLNMRGDAYVWADQVSRDNADWHTTYTTDLPPRY